MAHQQKAGIGPTPDVLLANAQAAVASIGQQLRKQDAPLDEMVSLADKMLQELRTGDLSPRQYYELNLRVCEELRHLQFWLVDLEKKNKVKMVDLYQRVQYVSSAVPRLYLMCTVGAAYCSLLGSPAKEVMKDMLEMCKCVQHPMRGLFLRNYLSTLTKDKLEMLGGPKERCEFVLQNFSEMTRLWVRMQPPKKRLIDPSEPPEDPKEAQKRQDALNKREVERRQLCQLIGVNLHRLSESVPSLDLYEHLVLPRVLDILSSSGDAFAQTYLSDIICQVIPNRYQIATLKTFLETICGPDMAPGMNIYQVLSTQMDRLADELLNSSKRDQDDEPDDEASLQNDPSQVGSRLFDLYFENIRKLSTADSLLPFKDQLGLHVSLLRFQSRVDGKRLDRVDQILGSIAEALESGRRIDAQEEMSIAELLRAPLESPQGDVLGVLQLSRFPRLLTFLGADNRRSVALKLLKAVIHNPDKVEEVDLLERLFDLLVPVVVGGAEAGSGVDADEEARCDALLARLIHKLHHENPNDLVKLLVAARRRFEQCTNDVRKARTLVPVCYRLMELVGTRKQALTDVRSPLQEVYSICSILGENSESNSVKDLVGRVLVNAALAADRAREEAVAYECLVQAFSTYETLADSKLQASQVPFLVGAVQTLTSLGKDNMDVVQARTALYAAQLLKKTDQARHVALSAHLFWSVTPERQLREGESPPVPGRNSKRALECLQRALKTVDSMQHVATPQTKSQIVALFVEILNQYIFMFQAGADKVKAQFITELVQLITEQLASANPPVDASVEVFYRKTMAYLRKLTSKGGRFAEFASTLDHNSMNNNNNSAFDSGPDPVL